MLKKTTILSILVLVFGFTNAIKAEMSLSGYAEFFAGSADQGTIYGAENNSGIDKAGLSNGQYSRVDATYSTTLDSGIEVTGFMNVSNRDCSGSFTDNCNVTNENSLTFSGGFGSISLGERFAAGAAMLSRLTASGPTAEPDGAIIGHFYTGDSQNVYGAENEVNYANNAMKVMYMSNVYSGLSFAASYTPNTANDGLAANNVGQATISDGRWGDFNDLLSVFAKYEIDVDGIGLQIVYGTQTGNAGQVGGSNYNDLDETAYSAKITYAGLEVDYRKNEADSSGYVKNGTNGNDEGTTVCAVYGAGNFRVGACNAETSYTDTSNYTNSSTKRTYSADYSLGGGMTVGAVYFDYGQTANSATRTDVEGIMTMISVGF